MKCEHCKQNEATCFYQITNNNGTTALSLCAECAAALKLNHAAYHDPFGGFGADMSHLFDSLFGMPIKAAPKNEKACPTCGATWHEIAKGGKVLCADCYTAFREELAPTLRSLHGAATHTGRAPAKERKARERDEKLATLRRELCKAIDEQNFERAAVLRDEIRAWNEKQGEV